MPAIVSTPLGSPFCEGLMSTRATSMPPTVSTSSIPSRRVLVVSTSKRSDRSAPAPRRTKRWPSTTRQHGRSLRAASSVGTMQKRSAALLGWRPWLDPSPGAATAGAIFPPRALFSIGPDRAVQSSRDLGHLEVPLRRRRDGGAGPLGRPAGADQGARRAPLDPGAVPRAALLDPPPRRAPDEPPRHEGRLHAVAAGRRDRRPRGRPGARRQ